LTNSKQTIVVLEDDARRINEMRKVIVNIGFRDRTMFFDNANTLCEWWTENLAQVALMSLDYDLDTTAALESIDPGSGGDVVELILNTNQMFPVIIHSSNAMRAPAMHMNLTLAGWTDTLLSPYTSASSWLEVVERSLPAKNAE